MSCGSLSLWFVVVSVLACASSFFTPAPFPLVCVVSSMPMCHHPHPMCRVSVLCEACHMHCVVVGTLQHTALLCSILSALLFLSLSLPPPSPQKNTEGCGEKRGRKVWLGKREEEEEERCDAKTSGKKGAKREKEITTPGVPRLSPTLVLTRPKQA